MPFYTESPDHAFRLGDIVEGFVIGTANLPKLKSDAYHIDIDKSFAVILTPCCSIREEKILLAPLRKINPLYLVTPYLKEDLTNINRPMTRLQSFPPGRLKAMSDDERVAIEADTKREFEFCSYFVYAPHDLLPKYEMTVDKKKVPVGHHRIDFREIQQVKCKEIISPENSPLTAKVLQLSRTSRDKLRSKLSFYFWREPKADKR